MKDARLLASLTAVGRVLRWKPRTYGQAWLYPALLATVPTLIVFCILGQATGGTNLSWPSQARVGPLLERPSRQWVAYRCRENRMRHARSGE